MEGWTWRGDWGEESHSLLLYQMRIGTFWVDRMAKRLVPPRPGPRSRPPPCLPLATYRLPQHTRTSTHSRWRVTALDVVGKGSDDLMTGVKELFLI